MSKIFSIISSTCGYAASLAFSALAVLGARELAEQILGVDFGAARPGIVLCAAVVVAGCHRTLSRNSDKEPAPAYRKEKHAGRLEPTHSGRSISEETPALKPLIDTKESGRPVAETIAEGLDLQLEMIRRALDLTTVAVLRIAPGGRELRLSSLATTRRDIVAGPYPAGSGITGALSGARGEIAVAPARAGFAGLPYYRDGKGVGGLFAARLPATAEVPGGEKPGAILCVDRSSDSPWSDSELETLRLASRRLSFDLRTGRRLEEMDRDCNDLQNVCIGLRELNGGLGLDSAFDSTISAVTALAPADFTAISLLEEGGHRIVRAEGTHSEKLLDQLYPEDQGLVGQVFKFKRPLPDGGKYNGASPVFSDAHLFSGFRSLLILPLREEDGEPVGTLTVAAKKEGVFTRSRREILELIATQVAVKIDLAQAHEQINRMATTDSLTGLANHHAFHHGFGVMLNRARRRRTPLGLLLCDVDHFKRVNDNYGHPFGDEVLKAVAGALAGERRMVDMAARYGGEEFAVVLEDPNRRGALQTAERLRRTVEALELWHNQEPVKITISVGLALYPDDGETIPELIDHADKALYQAKGSGRNRVVEWAKTTVDADRSDA